MSSFTLKGAHAQISPPWHTGCFTSHHYPWNWGS